MCLYCFRFTIDSSVIIAGQKLFILQGDRSHSLQWDKYGFRLECPQGAVSKDTEVAVTALAGGNFKVPNRAVAKAAAGDALAASLLQDHVRHFNGLLTIIKVISSILFF